MYLLHSWFNFVYLLHSWFNFCIYSILDLTQKSALLNKQLRLVAFKLISKLVFLSIGLIKNELFEKTSWRKNTICSAHIPYKGRALRDASVQDPRDKISTKYLKKKLFYSQNPNLNFWKKRYFKKELSRGLRYL